MRWAKYAIDWQEKIDEQRFEPTPKLTWKSAYWFNDDGNFLWARTYLAQANIPYEIINDTYVDEYLILTDLEYKS